MMAAVPEHYTIELGFNNYEQFFRIPVNPETIEISESGQGKTYDIVGYGGGTQETRAGEINVIGSPRLKEIRFQSLFPAQYGPYVVVEESALLQPVRYISYLQAWKASKRPIRFVYYGSDMYISIPASIEKLEWKERAGSPGTIEYSLSLKEYVFYSARRATVVTNEAGETILVRERPDRPDERERPETYTVQPGDDLIKIAMRFYNLDSSRARDIQKLNGLTDAETRPLETGRVLRLPQV
jgi:hypothetical protein